MTIVQESIVDSSKLLEKEFEIREWELQNLKGISRGLEKNDGREKETLKEYINSHQEE